MTLIIIYIRNINDKTSEKELQHFDLKKLMLQFVNIYWHDYLLNMPIYLNVELYVEHTSFANVCSVGPNITKLMNIFYAIDI